MCIAAAIAGAAVVAAGASVYAGNKQASAATEAANTTVGENAREFNLARADTAPQRALGANATATLSKLYGYGPNTPADANTGAFTGAPSKSGDLSAFQQSPNYAFNLQEGEKAVENSNVAKGLGLSGAQLKGATRYASGLASNTYNDYVNQLMQQAGLGSTANAQSAAAGAQMTANDTSALNNEANARESAYNTQAQGVNNSVQGGISNYLLSRYLGAPTYTTAAPGLNAYQATGAYA